MWLNDDLGEGPVIKAARRALKTGNMNYVLVWVPEESEKKLKNLFEKTFCEQRAGKDGQNIAIGWYFETVSRLHCAGERALFTCMKNAGPDESTVILKAERAIETGDEKEIAEFVPKNYEDDFRHRFRDVMEKKNYAMNNVTAGRVYVAAFIDFIRYLHHTSASIPGKTDQREL
jgi:hypothetical protein